MSDEVRLFPAWRQAERDLLARGLRDGEVIPMAWFRDAFGIPESDNNTSIAEHERRRMLFNTLIGNLCESLLVDHATKLRLVPGVGYMVVPPDQQTRFALRDRGAEVLRAVGHLCREIQHVRLDQLTDSQRAENADALAKAGRLRQLLTRRLLT